MMALEDKKMKDDDIGLGGQDDHGTGWQGDDVQGEHLQPGVPLVGGLVGLDN